MGDQAERLHGVESPVSANFCYFLLPVAIYDDDVLGLA